MGAGDGAPQPNGGIKWNDAKAIKSQAVCKTHKKTNCMPWIGAIYWIDFLAVRSNRNISAARWDRSNGKEGGFCIGHKVRYCRLKNVYLKVHTWAAKEMCHRIQFHTLSTQCNNLLATTCHSNYHSDLLVSVVAATQRPVLMGKLFICNNKLMTIQMKNVLIPWNIAPGYIIINKVVFQKANQSFRPSVSSNSEILNGIVYFWWEWWRCAG